MCVLQGKSLLFSLLAQSGSCLLQNINWNKRQSCNICQSSRPGVVKEQRLGKGGGFNERDDVKYKVCANC